jgi:acyl transferase domain-containing protein
MAILEGIYAHIFRFLSEDGKCHTYDHRTSGYPRGEGVASAILKPLDAARRDGDPVRTVIRQSAVDQDGRTAGITLPSSSAQESLIRSAYLSADLDPSHTTYFEAHGTRTPAGWSCIALFLLIMLMNVRQSSRSRDNL